MTDTRTQILEIAERLIRTGGYNNCSFRDIAAEIGIKSASVHHHFPAKQDLAVAVAHRYSESFLQALGEPAPKEGEPATRITRYCDVFRTSYAASGRACLCGILSSEAGLLPEGVQREIAAFIDANIAWLEQAVAGNRKIPAAETRRTARRIYATMQGAMAVATLKQDRQWLDDVARSTIALCAAG